MPTRIAHVVGALLVYAAADAPSVTHRPLNLPTPPAPRLRLPGVHAHEPVVAPKLEVKPLRARPKGPSPKLSVPGLRTLDPGDPDADESGDGGLED